jgi:hypothetical protein
MGADVFGAVASSTLADRLAHPRARWRTSVWPCTTPATNEFVTVILVALLGVAALLLTPRRTQQRQES